MWLSTECSAACGRRSERPQQTRAGASAFARKEEKKKNLLATAQDPRVSRTLSLLFLVHVPAPSSPASRNSFSFSVSSRSLALVNADFFLPREHSASSKETAAGQPGTPRRLEPPLITREKKKEENERSKASSSSSASSRPPFSCGSRKENSKEKVKKTDTKERRRESSFFLSFYHAWSSRSVLRLGIFLPSLNLPRRTDTSLQRHRSPVTPAGLSSQHTDDTQW